MNSQLTRMADMLCEQDLRIRKLIPDLPQQSFLIMLSRCGIDDKDMFHEACPLSNNF